MWTGKEERQTFEVLRIWECLKQITVQTQETPLHPRHDSCSSRGDSQAHNGTDKKVEWLMVLVYFSFKLQCK